MQAGLLTVPAGERVLRLVPPLIVNEAEVDKAVDLLEKAMEGLMAK